MAFDTNERSRWLFRIKDADGNLVANLTKATNKRVKLGLNKPGEATFTYSLKDFSELATSINSTVTALLGIGRFTLECLRDGSVFFAGQILFFKREVNSISAEISVKALGFFWLLSTRFAGLTSDRVFTATDAGAIAWTLIDETQDLTNGDFGFTQGTIQTSLNRTLTYTRKSIKEAIEDLAFADGGFDFEVDENKILNIFYPFKGSDKTDTVIFRYPGPQIQSISEEQDGTKLANHALIIGKGWGTDELNVERDNTDSQSALKRRDKIVTVKDIDNATVLGDIADEVINVFGSVNPVLKINYNDNSRGPDLSTFVVGDFINLKIEEDFWSSEQTFRIFEIHVNVDNRDKEKITLVVGLI